MLHSFCPVQSCREIPKLRSLRYTYKFQRQWISCEIFKLIDRKCSHISCECHKSNEHLYTTESFSEATERRWNIPLATHDVRLYREEKNIFFSSRYDWTFFVCKSPPSSSSISNDGNKVNLIIFRVCRANERIYINWARICVYECAWEMARCWKTPPAHTERECTHISKLHIGLGYIDEICSHRKFCHSNVMLFKRICIAYYIGMQLEHNCHHTCSMGWLFETVQNILLKWIE